MAEATLPPLPSLPPEQANAANMADATNPSPKPTPIPAVAAPESLTPHTLKEFSQPRGSAADLGTPLSIDAQTQRAKPSPPERLEILPEAIPVIRPNQPANSTNDRPFLPLPSPTPPESLPQAPERSPVQNSAQPQQIPQNAGSSELPIPPPGIASPPVKTDKPGIQTIDTVPPPAPLPVGVMVGDRTVLSSTLARGREDGKQATNFQDWLISFDDFVKALKFNQTVLNDGQLELRSLGLVVRIKPEELRQDPDLGRVISISDIQTRLNIPVSFDINEYAIRFDPPWLGQSKRQGVAKSAPVVTDGLPHVKPPSATLTAIQAETSIAGEMSPDRSTTTATGSVTAMGTIAGGSWFLKFSQPNLLEVPTWQLSELQFLRQTPLTDYVLGSHSPFWPSQSQGDFWGGTIVQRHGFTAPPPSGAGFDPGQRMQASLVGRTVAGKAEPGTLVQLVEGSGDLVVADTLVDTSGIYRFEDIPSNGSYRVLLYPNGRLTAQPIVRTANFMTLPTQLPVGASAWMISAGFSRQRQGDHDWFGKFTNFRGGLLYRRGLSEDLTLGVGFAYDRTLIGLTELFYQPTKIPLQLTAKASFTPTDNRPLQLEANLRWQPSQRFSLNLSHDRLSQQATLNWQLTRSLFLNLKADSRERAIAAGLRFSHSTPTFSLQAGIDWNTKHEWRWNLRSTLGKLTLNHLGNPVSTSTELSYNLLPRQNSERLSLLRFNYETRNLKERRSYLATLGWRYRSPVLPNGRTAWELEIAYGIGSSGHGMMISLGTGVIPGIFLRARYQGIALDSTQRSFRIEISPNLQIQGGLNTAHPSVELLRSLGGIQVMPFFDDNGNARRDRGEKLYTQEANLLLLLNHQPIISFRPQISRHGIFVNLAPGLYRLDIDPAGFPIDWKASVPAYGVEVVAGSYTSVFVPLTRSYTVSGIVKDASGQPLGSGQVEAISLQTKQKIVSVTNGAGVFFLEGLTQDSYQLLVNGRPAQPSQLTIDTQSPPLQEVNIQLF